MGFSIFSAGMVGKSRLLEIAHGCGLIQYESTKYYAKHVLETCRCGARDRVNHTQLFPVEQYSSVSRLDKALAEMTPRRHRTSFDEFDPVSLATARSILNATRRAYWCHFNRAISPMKWHERVYLLDPKAPLALTPSDGDAGKLTSFLLGVPPLPFSPSLICSLSVFAATLRCLTPSFLWSGCLVLMVL